MQAALARNGRAKNFLVVDTAFAELGAVSSLSSQESPADIWPQIVSDKDMGAVNPLGLLSTLNLLSKSNNICYLNPSFGYYFELFYLEPHGLIYQLKTLPEDTLLPPPLSTNLIAENQNFWTQTVENELPRIEKASTATEPAEVRQQSGRLAAHASARPDGPQSQRPAGRQFLFALAELLGRPAPARRPAHRRRRTVSPMPQQSIPTTSSPSINLDFQPDSLQAGAAN